VLSLIRSLRHLSARLVATAVLALVSTAALAQERLIMPYACSAYGGRVTLTPSREESYRIYGQREERPYTVCSPINPNACRTWLLHRFDLDCAGTRVDWMSVVEAASEQANGRAWIENGRLRMRMNPFWNRDAGQDDDPCPRWRRRGPYGDDCADRGFQRRGPVVEMPAGFAPAFGLPVRFAGSDLPPMPADPRAGAEAPGRSGPAWSARVEPPRDVPARDRPGREPFAKDPPAKTPQVAGSTTTAPGTPSTTPKPAVRPAAQTETAVDTAAPEQTKPKLPEPPRQVAAAEPVTSSGNTGAGSIGTGSITPKIINRPATEQTSAGQGMTSKPTTPYAEQALSKVAEAKPSIEAVSSVKPATTPDATPGHSTLTAFAPSATTQALVGFAGLVALALGLFAWTRHREQMSLAAAGTREFGSVSLDGKTARPKVWSSATALPRPPRPAQPNPPRPPRATQAATTFGNGQVPRTRQEACDVLGTSPDAGEVAIKKIVEGLRQSWHPDLATSEADRQLREQRTTQINVAWEILSGKRAPA
jgi:hypothetical protein